MNTEKPMMRGVLNEQPGFIVSEHNFNNKSYVDKMHGRQQGNQPKVLGILNQAVS